MQAPPCRGELGATTRAAAGIAFHASTIANKGEIAAFSASITLIALGFGLTDALA